MQPQSTLADLYDLLNKIYSLPEFKRKLKEAFGKDYTIFDGKKSDITKYHYFQKLMSALKEAQKELQDKKLSLSDEYQLTDFLKMLVKQMMGQDKPLDREVHFETTNSIRKKSIFLEKAGVQRILVIVSPLPCKYDDYGLVEDTGVSPASIDELFEVMASYFSKSRGDLFGIIFTIEGAKITWIKNYKPEEGLKSDQFSVFNIDFFAISLQNFLSDILDNRIDEMPLQLVLNLQGIYIFLDFLCCIICKSKSEN